MRVRIDKLALQRPLYRAQGVVDKKSSTPVLSAVHVVATENQQLIFTATDYDVTLAAECTAEVSEPGAVLINGKAFYDVVRGLADGVQVTLSSDGSQRVRVESGRAYYHLNGLGPEEFPDVVEESGGRSLVIDKAQIDAMLRRTLISVSNDDSRPALNGVLLEIEPHGEGTALLRMVTTDGHRLSRVERMVATSGYDGGQHRTIVHRRGAAELARIFESNDPSVRIELLGRNIVFESDRTRLQVRQIEESFPDYQRVIPTRGDISVSVSRLQLASAIRRVATLGLSKHALLRVDLEPGRLSLEMTNVEFGDAHETIEVPDHQGAKVSVGFNPRYLLDVLGVLESESVQLELSDQFSPCLVHSDEEPGSVFVVMPMRL